MSKKIELDAEVASLLRKRAKYTDEKVLAVEDALEFFIACTENLESNPEVYDHAYVEKSKISSRSRFKNSPKERLEAAINFATIHKLILGTFDYTYRGNSGRPTEMIAIKWDVPEGENPMSQWNDLMDILIRGESRRELSALITSIVKKPWCAKEDWKSTGPYGSPERGLKGAVFPPHIIMTQLNKKQTIAEVNEWVEEHLADPAGQRMAHCPFCQGVFLHM